MASVASLHVYPVKGCRGLELSSTEVLTTGLAGDRDWMLVDAAGRFLSQREIPRLCLVRATPSNDGLGLELEGMDPLWVSREAGGEVREVSVWRDTVAAIDAGDAAAHWLQLALGIHARLVRFDPIRKRACDARYAGGSGAHTRFADGYPLLIIGEASLVDLNRRLRSPLPMNRFRPNLVLAGLEAYDEDHLESVRIGEITLRMVKPCTRCQVTTIDQSSARPSGDEPLATLAHYRNHPELGGVAFGMNAIVTSGAGRTVRIGDDADVLFRF